jgi:hypothetical protein
MTPYEQEDGRAQWPVRGKDNAPDQGCEQDTSPITPRPWIRLAVVLLTWILVVVGLRLCCGCASPNKPTAKPGWVTPAWGGTTNELPPWPTP